MEHCIKCCKDNCYFWRNGYCYSTTISLDNTGTCMTYKTDDYEAVWKFHYVTENNHDGFEPSSSSWYTCSNCGHEESYDNLNICPNCKSKMRKPMP